MFKVSSIIIWAFLSFGRNTLGKNVVNNTPKESTVQKQQQHRIVVSVLADAAAHGVHCARSIRQEVEGAQQASLNLAIVMPTGSTPLPMYQEILQDWRRAPYNFENVEFYGSDEYVGLAPNDPHSYYYYFEQNFLKDLVGQKMGFRRENIHLFRSGKNLAETEAFAKERREKLRSRLDDPKWRVVMFGGIGVDPTHVAFNDFRQELENVKGEDAREAFARETQTRIVPLDFGTRDANKRFFDHRIESVPLHAITIGFKEILDADRVVIMANSPNKKEAIRKMFADRPSYKVPASLVRLNSHQVDIVLTRDAYTPIDGKDAQVEGLLSVLEAAPERSSYLIPRGQTKPVDALIHGVAVPSGAYVLVLGDDYASNIADALVDYVDEGHLIEVQLPKTNATKNKKLGILGSRHVLEGQQEHVDEVMAAFQKKVDEKQPGVIVLPAELLSGELDNRVHLFLQEKLSKPDAYKPAILYYDTPLSRVASYNWLLAVTEKDLEKQKKALGHHLTQIRRSPLREIPLVRAGETMNDFRVVSGLRFRSEYVGLEAYKLYSLRNGSFNFNDKSNPDEALIYELPLGEKDHLVIVSPHPDDAEIGTAGLLVKAGMQRVPTTVLNATSGSHAMILIRDALDNSEVKRLGLFKGVASPRGEEVIKDPLMRAQVRFFESSMAVHELNPHANVKSLDLEFYDNGYLITEADRRLVYENLNSAFKNCSGHLVLAMPVAMDKHLCHRRTTEVFLDQIQLISQQNPEKKILVIYYRTPWTGASNLYMYTTKGTHSLESEALIGTELLLGKSGAGLSLRNQLPANEAWAMRVRDF